MSFSSWSELKKVKLSDLIFTGALKTDLHRAVFNRAADKMAEHNPSFSEGLQFLEQLTDLILMGHNEELFNEQHRWASWQQQIHRLRFPFTGKRDEELKKKYEQLPWPAGAKVKFERRGDRAGIEVRLFISNQADLIKILASLERVQKELRWD